VASVLLDVVSLVVVVVVGGLAVPRDVPRFVVVVVASVVAAAVVVVRCVVIDRFTLVVEGGWVTVGS